MSRLKSHGLFPDIPVVNGEATDPEIQVDGQDHLLFCSNNLLGMSGHKDVKAAAPPSLRHRVLLSFEAEADGVAADTVVRSVVAAVRQNNRIVEEVGRAYGATVVDLFSGIAEPADFADALHVNAAGQEKKASLIQEGIEDVLNRVRGEKGSPRRPTHGAAAEEVEVDVEDGLARLPLAVAD